ncbi:hypothetical protein AYO45_03540 [Gammaproteobacteria bacterium SCGC AG-212-F23]|nr:hypothetical protein AYO45_03540 [Gammaproteobacteria bacterium SCGC AG-212-F23]
MQSHLSNNSAHSKQPLVDHKEHLTASGSSSSSTAATSSSSSSSSSQTPNLQYKPYDFLMLSALAYKYMDTTPNPEYDDNISFSVKKNSKESLNSSIQPTIIKKLIIKVQFEDNEKQEREYFEKLANDGWSVISSHDIGISEISHGYYAIAFINDKTKAIIISHRGSVGLTNFTYSAFAMHQKKGGSLTMKWSTKDASGKSVPLPNQLPSQDDADLFVFALQRFSANYTIFHTGHSLGGAHAQLCAAKEKEGRAISFDAFGVKELIDAKQILNNDIKNRITNYIMDKNYINKSNTHLSPIIKVKLPAVVQDKLTALEEEKSTGIIDSFCSFFSSPFKKNSLLHQIGNFVLAFDSITGHPVEEIIHAGIEEPGNSLTNDEEPPAKKQKISHPGSNTTVQSVAAAVVVAGSSPIHATNTKNVSPLNTALQSNSSILSSNTLSR